MKTIDKAVAEARARQALPTASVRRAIRKRAGVTQLDVARAVGVSAAEVSRWESGRRTPRNAETVAAYLAVLDQLAERAGLLPAGDGGR